MRAVTIRGTGQKHPGGGSGTHLRFSSDSARCRPGVLGEVTYQEPRTQWCVVGTQHAAIIVGPHLSCLQEMNVDVIWERRSDNSVVNSIRKRSMFQI